MKKSKYLEPHQVSKGQTIRTANGSLKVHATSVAGKGVIFTGDNEAGKIESFFSLNVVEVIQ